MCLCSYWQLQCWCYLSGPALSYWSACFGSFSMLHQLISTRPLTLRTQTLGSCRNWHCHSSYWRSPQLPVSTFRSSIVCHPAILCGTCPWRHGFSAMTRIKKRGYILTPNGIYEGWRCTLLSKELFLQASFHQRDAASPTSTTRHLSNLQIPYLLNEMESRHIDFVCSALDLTLSKNPIRSRRPRSSCQAPTFVDSSTMHQCYLTNSPGRPLPVTKTKRIQIRASTVTDT